MKLSILPFLLFSVSVFTQEIGEFISLAPASQTTDFVIPATHRFQKIIESGDSFSQGGTQGVKNDFSGYVPIAGSSEQGYLGISDESIPGGVAILDLNYNTGTRLWETTRSEAVDFSSVYATVANCSGTVTPWNTIITCEEWTSRNLENNSSFPYEGNRDFNNDGYDDFGWAIEIDPVTKKVIDQPGGLNGGDKLWAMGNFRHENAVIHSNERTVYQGVDNGIGYLYKFVANTAQNLSSGNLFVYKGSKNGPGNWIQIANSTQAEQNSTIDLSAAVSATVFTGIEDVEIGPDGMVYFAVKGEDRVYRFQDANPISGTSVPVMETFVGNATYAVAHENGTSNVPWGAGNDNLAFDNEGNLWVMQDAGNLQNYIWVVENGHTQSNPKVKIFARTPRQSEPTGITFSPDNRFLFMSIQHPNGNNGSTTQLDAAGNAIGFNKSITLVISRNVPTNQNQTWYLDADGDGYAVSNTVSSATSPGVGYTLNVIPTTDCDDTDETINPETVWYLDADGDGFAVAPTVQSCLNPGTGYSRTVIPTTDCNDSDASVNAISTWYLDADGDGFAHSETIESCQSPGANYTTAVLPTTDCDDSDASVNGISTWYLDADGDGFAEADTIESCQSPGSNYTTTVLPTTDCDDSDDSINGISTWYLDADGDGFAEADTIESCQSPGSNYTTTVLPTTDCDDSDASINGISTWYLDADGDGFAQEDTIESCQSPGSNYTTNVLPTTDCDDSDASINGISTWYLDADGDGFAEADTIESCQSPGSNYTTNVLPTTDCDDSDASINGISTWYLDVDGDGFAQAETIESCPSPGAGYTTDVLPTTDCDDDNSLFTLETLWYLDADNDGFADDIPLSSCSSPGEGYTQEELPLRNELTGNGPILYPNPTESSVSVLLEETYENLLLEIWAPNGVRVAKETIFNTDLVTFDLIGYQNGHYFLQISSDEKRIAFYKVIKK
ncbi:MAG: alkaline phosphatase PhoX [Maribacter sp.]